MDAFIPYNYSIVRFFTFVHSPTQETRKIRRLLISSAEVDEKQRFVLGRSYIEQKKSNMKKLTSKAKKLTSGGDSGSGKSSFSSSSTQFSLSLSGGGGSKAKKREKQQQVTLRESSVSWPFLEIKKSF